MKIIKISGHLSTQLDNGLWPVGNKITELYYSDKKKHPYYMFVINILFFRIINS